VVLLLMVAVRAGQQVAQLKKRQLASCRAQQERAGQQATEQLQPRRLLLLLTARGAAVSVLTASGRLCLCGRAVWWLRYAIAETDAVHTLQVLDELHGGEEGCSAVSARKQLRV